MQRRQYLALLAVITPLGFATKFYSGPAAGWISSHVGGFFYVLFWAFVVLAISPKFSRRGVAIGVFLVTSALEFLQLWHPALLGARASHISRPRPVRQHIRVVRLPVLCLRCVGCLCHCPKCPVVRLSSFPFGHLDLNPVRLLDQNVCPRDLALVVELSDASRDGAETSSNEIAGLPSVSRPIQRCPEACVHRCDQIGLHLRGLARIDQAGRSRLRPSLEECSRGSPLSSSRGGAEHCAAAAERSSPFLRDPSQESGEALDFERSAIPASGLHPNRTEGRPPPS